jgi:hypothetical protein
MRLHQRQGILVGAKDGRNRRGLSHEEEDTYRAIDAGCITSAERPAKE